MDNVEKYNEWHQQLAGYEADLSGLHHPWHRTVAKLLPDLEKSRVLEIGCGRGDFSIWLADKYPESHITGVDFSDQAIAIAKAKGATDGPTFKVENAESLSFPDASFDCVISCECIEHVSFPARMACEVHRVLRPGGRFIITTENYLNGMLLLWLKSWLTAQPFNSGSGVQPHENFFLYWRVKTMLESQGLSVQHMESNHYQWLLLPQTDPMKLLTFDFKQPFFKKLFRPFGRHFTFSGRRRAS
jgi:ubiquinone/menaquinone biosynthesis C-methylase UbiE